MLTDTDRDDEKTNPTLVIFCRLCGEHFFARFSEDPAVVKNHRDVCANDGDYPVPPHIDGMTIDIVASRNG